MNFFTERGFIFLLCEKFNNKEVFFVIYSNWMSYLKDDAKINKIAIPGSHNAGSYTMNELARCQDDDFYTQFNYGIRHFCIRLDTKKDGTIIVSHGISKGEPFEAVLYQIRKMLNKNDSEFLILDIREYYNQQFGPLKLHFTADPKKVDELIEKYLEPEKYALWDFENIGDVTMGDIRKSGKRYIIVNEKKDYKYSSDCPCILPWDKKVYGSLASDFARGIIDIFDNNSTEGFYWFQTQQTPNPGTDVKLTTPHRLDMSVRPYFKHIIEQLAINPERLEKVNIIAGDFMTYDYSKVRDILRLNLIKSLVDEEYEAAYDLGLYT